MFELVRQNDLKRLKGGGLIALLVIIALIAVIYLIVKNVIYPPLPECANPTSSLDILPWEEKDRMIQLGQERDLASTEEQISIKNGLFLDIRVIETKKPGGMSIIVEPDGKITGAWNSDFNEDVEGGGTRNFVVNTEFEGNVDPSNVYFDKNGEDYSRLFFIAKGDASILGHDLSSNAAAHGILPIWVSGWIDKEEEVVGKAVILKSRKSYKTYNFKSAYNQEKMKQKYEKKLLEQQQEEI